MVKNSLKISLIISVAFSLTLSSCSTNNGVNSPAGIAGTNGSEGAMGETGATGPQGVQGLTGKDGIPGATGIAGAQGLSGTNGAMGLVGPVGPVGPAGPAGPMSQSWDSYETSNQVVLTPGINAWAAMTTVVAQALDTGTYLVTATASAVGDNVLCNLFSDNAAYSVGTATDGNTISLTAPINISDTGVLVSLKCSNNSGFAFMQNAYIVATQIDQTHSSGWTN